MLLYPWPEYILKLDIYPGTLWSQIMPIGGSKIKSTFEFPKRVACNNILIWKSNSFEQFSQNTSYWLRSEQLVILFKIVIVKV